MGVGAMAGVSAKDLTHVLSPFGSAELNGSGKQQQAPQDGPGLIKLPFSKARFRFLRMFDIFFLFSMQLLHIRFQVLYSLLMRGAVYLHPTSVTIEVYTPVLFPEVPHFRSLRHVLLNPPKLTWQKNQKLL